MWYRRIRIGALGLLGVLIMMMYRAIINLPEEDVKSVMGRNENHLSIQALTRSISLINSIEYNYTVKTMGLGGKKETIESRIYYEKPCYLRMEIKNGKNINIDIYTVGGMYEYFPLSQVAYYREKWKDDDNISFQLNDKLQDIKIRGKYESYKMDKINGKDCEVIRSIDNQGTKIYEHRIWLTELNGLKLPLREEYLTDGDISSIHEYEYISINKDIDNSIFELKKSPNLQIHNAEGIPKLVKDENTAEKYVGFNVITPKYIPENFSINEIFVIPPVKNPSVLMSYTSDLETIYFNQKYLRKNELSTTEDDKVIKKDGKSFAVHKVFNDSISVRWVKNGIEYEITGPDSLKGEIIKLIESISGSKIAID